MKKRCKHCGEIKPLEDFYKATSASDGHRGECKVCSAAARRAWYHANRDAVVAKVKRWKAENPERHRENMKRQRQNPARQRRERDTYLRRKYGITIEEYEAKLADQRGVCAICGRRPNPKIALHVDHDHDSGAVRGLTCFRCNQAMGALQEDPFLLRAAAAYLEAHDPSVQDQIAAVRDRVRNLPPPSWKQSA